MIAWMLVLIAGRGIGDGIETRHADLLEVSHVTDRQTGCVTFTQVIAWRMHPEDRGRFHCWGWRMMHPHERPMACGGGWSVVGNDPSIRIVAPMIRESWSVIDPESEDRRRWWRGEQPPNLFEVVSKAARVRREPQIDPVRDGCHE